MHINYGYLFILATACVNEKGVYFLMFKNSNIRFSNLASCLDPVQNHGSSELQNIATPVVADVLPPGRINLNAMEAQWIVTPVLQATTTSTTSPAMSI